MKGMKWTKQKATKDTSGHWWTSTNTRKKVKLYRPKGKKMWVGEIDGIVVPCPWAELVGSRWSRHIPRKRWRNVDAAKEFLEEWFDE